MNDRLLKYLALAEVCGRRRLVLLLLLLRLLRLPLRLLRLLVLPLIEYKKKKAASVRGTRKCMRNLPAAQTHKSASAVAAGANPKLLLLFLRPRYSHTHKHTRAHTRSHNQFCVASRTPSMVAHIANDNSQGSPYCAFFVLRCARKITSFPGNV